MWEFLEYYEEEIKKIKEISKVIIVAFLFIFLLFLLIKTFFLNRPKIKLEEVTVSYLKLAQTKNYQSGEDYLYPDFKKVKIFEEEYDYLRNFFHIFQISQPEKEGEEPIFEIKDKRIEKNKAIIEIFEKTGKKEGWFFFGYYLPKEISFKVSLEKIGNWKKGYEWKIIEINSPDLIKWVKFGERVELEKGIFVRPIKLEEYRPENTKIPEGQKILSLEVEYENETEKEIEIDSFSNWRIIDQEKNIFYPPPISSAIALREPILMGILIKNDEIKKGYTVFDVPEKTIPKEIIYQDSQRKIIFQYGE